MSPDEAEAVPDELWAALVRRMVGEAEAVRAVTASLPTRS